MPGFLCPDIDAGVWQPGFHLFAGATPLPGYDFVVVGVPRMVPASPEAGDAVTFEADVMNIGSRAALPGTLGGKFMIEDQMVAFTDDHTSGLGVGETVTLVANSGTWTAVAGGHRLTFHVNDIVARYPDETNSSFAGNSAYVDFTVAPTSVGSLPFDFQVGGFELGTVAGIYWFEQSTFPGQPLGHTYTVGGGGALAFTQHIIDWMAYLQANPTKYLLLSVGLLQDSMATYDGVWHSAQWDNTAHDAAFAAFFATLHSYGVTDRIICRLGWEMNGNWFPWGALSDPAGYVRCFDRKAPLIRANAPGLLIEWTPNGFVTSGPQDVSVYKPNDANYDVAGMDTYWQVQVSGPDAASYFASDTLPMLQAKTAFALAHGKYEAISEWGVSGDDGRPFIDGCADHFAANSYLYASLFTGYDVGLQRSFSLTNSPLTKVRYRDRFIGLLP